MPQRSPHAALATSLFVGALVACASLQAAETAPKGSAVPASDAAAAPSLFGELLGIVLPLALIILVLLAVLYVARRRFGLTGQDAPLSVVQILPVGPRERIVLVKSRSGRVFAVGVANQSVNLITDLSLADLRLPDGTATAPVADDIDIAIRR